MRARQAARLWCSVAPPKLVALTLGDVMPVPGRGLRVLVCRSKTDQHQVERAHWRGQDSLRGYMQAVSWRFARGATALFSTPDGTAAPPVSDFSATITCMSCSKLGRGTKF